MAKAVIVILAEMDESHADLGRVVNGLKTAKELKEAGDDVQIIFDGGGSVSAVLLASPEHRLHRLWQQIEDKVEGICRHCARAFHVYEQAEELGIAFLAEYEQHPSLRSRIADGFQVITF